MNKTTAITLVVMTAIIVPVLAKCDIERNKVREQTVQLCISSGGQWSPTWGGYCDIGKD